MCTLLDVGRLAGRRQQQGMGGWAQCFAMAWRGGRGRMRGGSGRRGGGDKCIHVADSLCCAMGTGTVLWSNCASIKIDPGSEKNYTGHINLVSDCEKWTPPRENKNSVCLGLKLHRMMSYRDTPAHKATCRKTSVTTGHSASRQQHPLRLSAFSFQTPYLSF